MYLQASGNSLPIKREGKYLVLENVSDPSNVGAAARTAEALGTDGILVCGGCDPFSPKVLRASMGALLRFPVEVFADIAKAAERLEKAGVRFIARLCQIPIITLAKPTFQRAAPL